MMMMMMIMMMTQWLTLQLCLVTVGVTEWIECSRLDHVFYRRKLTPVSVLGPLRGEMGHRDRQTDDDDYYMCQSFESQTWLSGKIFVESVLESEQQQVTKGLKAPPPLSLKRQNLSQ